MTTAAALVLARNEVSDLRRSLREKEHRLQEALDALNAARREVFDLRRMIDAARKAPRDRLEVRSDLARRALAVLESRDFSEWIAPAGAVLWVKVVPWTVRAGSDLAPIVRALAPYIAHPSEKRRRHPTNGIPTPDRPRWIGLDLPALELAGLRLPAEMLQGPSEVTDDDRDDRESEG